MVPSRPITPLRATAAIKTGPGGEVIRPILEEVACFGFFGKGPLGRASRIAASVTSAMRLRLSLAVNRIPVHRNDVSFANFASGPMVQNTCFARSKGVFA